jgi:hypothetical protein
MIKNYFGCMLSKRKVDIFWAIHYQSIYPSPTMAVI